jgi:hypothetical protein
MSVFVLDVLDGLNSGVQNNPHSGKMHAWE